MTPPPAPPASAGVATAAPRPAAAARGAGADLLSRYRDDGPLAALLGGLARGRLRLDPVLLTVLGLVPLALLAALPGEIGSAGLGIGLAWFVLCAGLAAGRPCDTRLSFLVPPVLRCAEYALLVKLVLLDAAVRVAACFALLCALAFHHYDTVYRVRAGRPGPPLWVQRLGGGWDLRLLAAYGLFLLGWLEGGLWAGAGLLGALFVGESVASWVRPAPAPSTAAGRAAAASAAGTGDLAEEDEGVEE